MQSSPDRKHLEIPSIQSWQTTLVGELIWLYLPLLILQIDIH